MSTVQEIEQAIGKLAPQELDELFVWMEEHYSQSADARLKADLDAGHMDSPIREALATHDGGSARAF